MKLFKVSHWMSKALITASPITTLSDAHKLMDKANIRHLPIVAGNRLVSMITLNDVRREELAILAQYKGSGISPLVSQLKTISEIMVSNPPYVHPDASIAQAARLLLENKLTALPVVADEKLVGIITESDIFRLLVENQELSR